MNENQRKWLMYLQSKGVEFENVSVNGKIWHKGPWEFKNDRMTDGLHVAADYDVRLRLNEGLRFWGGD